MDEQAKDAITAAAIERLGELLDWVDAQTRQPGDPSLRSEVARQAREAAAELGPRRTS